MGDVVTCTAVLVKRDRAAGQEHLFLCVPPDWYPRIIHCRPKGEPLRGNRPEWEYEIKDGRLHLTPSLLCTDTKFHTDYHWSCAYVECPTGTSMFDHFYAINPGIEDRQL